MKNKKRLVIIPSDVAVYAFSGLFYIGFGCQYGFLTVATWWKAEIPEMDTEVNLIVWGIFLLLFLLCLAVASYKIIVDEKSVTVSFLRGIISHTYLWSDFKSCGLRHDTESDTVQLFLSVRQPPKYHWKWSIFKDLEFDYSPALYAIFQTMTPQIIYPLAEQPTSFEGKILADTELMQNRRTYYRTSVMFMVSYFLLAIVIMMKEIFWLDAVLFVVGLLLLLIYYSDIRPKLQKLNEEYYASYFLSMKK